MSRIAGSAKRTAASVIIGLSSGVDSTVAAWLLKQQGYNVIAVTFALSESTEDARGNSCCSPSLMARAKAIADHLGIPHYAVDMRQEFNAEVVGYFISEYAAGRTPNPCAKCNSRVRFRAMVDVAARLGAEAAATGHYARLIGTPPRLARGRDAQKDQSYVLAEVEPSLLERCLFPLGDYSKIQVRDLAAQIGIMELVSEESQEICFIDGEGYRHFLRERLGVRPGEVVDETGRVVGAHQGTYNYTIGQRKGLGSSVGEPLFVASVDPVEAKVVAAPRDRAVAQTVAISVSAVHRRPPKGRVLVQFRSMGRPVGGRLQGLEAIRLDEPATGVAPGQTIVVYDNEDVVLGGTVSFAHSGVD